MSVIFGTKMVFIASCRHPLLLSRARPRTRLRPRHRRLPLQHQRRRRYIGRVPTSRRGMAFLLLCLVAVQTTSPTQSTTGTQTPSTTSSQTASSTSTQTQTVSSTYGNRVVFSVTLLCRQVKATRRPRPRRPLAHCHPHKPAAPPLPLHRPAVLQSHPRKRLRRLR